MIVGLDLLTGCERVMGNKDKYVQLLKGLVNDQRETVEEIKVLSRNRHYEEALFKVHSLKGVSANIGATKLANALTKFEQVAKQENDKDLLIAQSEQIEHIFSTLSQDVLKAFDLVDSTEKEIEKTAISRVEMISLLEKAEPYIMKRKPLYCKEFVKKLNRIEFRKNLLLQQEDLAKSISKYDYTRALEIQRSLIETLRRMDDE